MADKQVSKTVVQYEVDSASINRVVKSADKVEAAITGSLDTIGDYSPVTRAAMSSVETGFEGLRRSIQADQTELEDLRRDLLALDDLVVTPEVQVTRSGSAAVGGAGGNGLESLDRASASASQIFSGLGQGEAANAAGLIGDTISAITTFGPAAGVAAAAGGALALVMSEVNRRFEEAKAGAEEYLARQGEVNALIAGGATSDSLQAQIDANNRDIEQAANTRSAMLTIQDQLKTAQANVAAAQDILLNPITQFDEAGNIIPPDGEAALQAYLAAQAQEAVVLQQLTDYSQGSITSAQGLTLALEGNQGVLDDLTAQNQTLQGALLSTGVAANDAASAIAQAEAARDRATQTELAAALEAEGLTAEQRAERVKALQEELESVQAAAQAEGISADYKAELAARTEDLNIQIRVFSSDITTAADATDAANKALERQTAAQDLYKDLIDESVDALQREGEIREKETDALEAYVEATAKHEQAIADLRAQADTKRQDDETKAREDREKTERDHAKRIADIQRKTNATLANAIRDRDALAYVLAQQAAKEQIDSENDAYAERQKDIDDALKKQLASQDKALKEALAKEEARWRDEKQTRDRAIAQIQNDLANAQAATASMQRQAAQQAFMIELDKEANLRGSYERQASIQSFYLDYMVSKSAAAWAAMASVIGGGSGIGSPGGAGAQPTPFADGGYVTRTGLALVHAGEKIYPPIMPAGRAAFGSSTTINQNAGGVTFNIRGNSPAQIRREVDTRLTDYFRAAGMV